MDRHGRGHSSLSVADVAALLDELGMNQYVPTFEEFAIDGLALVECEDADLIECGMNHKPVRQRSLWLLLPPPLLPPPIARTAHQPAAAGSSLTQLSARLSSQHRSKLLKHVAAMVGAEKAAVRSQTVHSPIALAHAVLLPHTSAMAVLDSGRQNQGIV